jgi:hypothetical protein
VGKGVILTDQDRLVLDSIDKQNDICNLLDR